MTVRVYLIELGTDFDGIFSRQMEICPRTSQVWWQAGSGKIGQLEKNRVCVVVVQLRQMVSWYVVVAHFAGNQDTEL